MAESDDVPIWRYMDLARYVSLLDRALFSLDPIDFQTPGKELGVGATFYTSVKTTAICRATPSNRRGER